MLALTLPTIRLPRPRFWSIFIIMTAALMWLSGIGAINGYVTLMLYLVIAPIIILMRDVFKRRERLWLHFVMVVPYVISIIMLVLMAGADDQFNEWVMSVF